jgi:hypothetical protein
MLLPVFLVMMVAQVAASPLQSGVVIGTLRDPTGKPAAGVRVAAVSPPELPNDQGAAAMIRIGETDAEGRFRLDDLPQGRYYISAGRVDQPTYYPGAKEMGSATIVSVVPGTMISGIDFTSSLPGKAHRTPRGSIRTFFPPTRAGGRL